MKYTIDLEGHKVWIMGELTTTDIAQLLDKLAAHERTQSGSRPISYNWKFKNGIEEAIPTNIV